MIYDLNDPHDVNRFSCRANKLIDRQKTVELREITTRSLKQNNYLYLILTAFAIETGYSVECVKQNFFQNEMQRKHFRADLLTAFSEQKSLSGVRQIADKGRNDNGNRPVP